VTANTSALQLFLNIYFTFSIVLCFVPVVSSEHFLVNLVVNKL